MTTYEQDREFDKRFTARATEIAEAMGDGWTLKLCEPYDVGYPVTRAELIGADGLAIHLRHDHGRIVASPSVPTRHGGMRSLRDWGVIGYQEKGPEASVTFDRPAKQIAGDIKRKVAEPYAPMWAKIRERQAEDAKGIAKARALLPVFENILLSQAWPRNGSGRDGVDFARGDEACLRAEGAEVTISHNGGATIKVTAYGDAAIDLARWVMERKRAEAKD